MVVGNSLKPEGADGQLRSSEDPAERLSNPYQTLDLCPAAVEIFTAMKQILLLSCCLSELQGVPALLLYLDRAGRTRTDNPSA